MLVSPVRRSGGDRARWARPSFSVDAILPWWVTERGEASSTASSRWPSGGLSKACHQRHVYQASTGVRPRDAQVPPRPHQTSTRSHPLPSPRRSKSGAGVVARSPFVQVHPRCLPISPSFHSRAHRFQSAAKAARTLRRGRLRWIASVLYGTT